MGRGLRKLTQWIFQRSQPMPLRWILIVTLVLQISLAVGLTGWLSWRHGQQGISAIATQLQMDITQRVRQRLESYLEAPQWANQAALNAIELELIDPQKPTALRRYFWQQVKASEQINTIQFGSKEGDYIGAGRWQNGDLVIKVADRAMNGEFRIYQAADGGVPSQEIDTHPNYDLLIRPWYRQAVSAKRSVWSDVYVMFSHKQLGMTLSQPVYDSSNNLLGVLGTDILLSELSTFLDSLEVGQTGESFILERSGNLIASSSDRAAVNIAAGKVQRLLALESSDSLVRGTVQSLTARFGDLSQIRRNQQFKSKVGGKTQFLQVTPFRDDRALDWLIVSAIPEADFQAPLNAYTRNTLILCLLAVAIAGLTGIFTARWLTRPIFHLAQAAADLAAGNWEGGKLRQWRWQTIRFRETALLAQAFEEMRQQLQQSFAALEGSKAELERRVERRTTDLKATNQELRQEIISHRQTEVALRQSEVKFRNLFENSQVGIFRTRLGDGLFLDANQCCAELLGYSSPAEIVGCKDAKDFYIRAGDRDRMIAQLQEQGEIHNFETQFRKQSGKAIWVLFSGRLNRNDSCLEGAIADVSNFYVALEKQKLAQEALEAREEMYRDLVQTANCIILRWDKNGYIRFLNDYGQDFFGYSEGEILGQSVLGTIVPETETSGRDLQSLMAAIRQNPEQYRFNENENRRKSGDRVWVSWANKPIFDRQGRLIEILSVGTDATARKQAEAALQEQQQYLRLIVDNIPQQVFWKDTHLVFKGCNKNWAEAAGLSSPEEVVGKTDYDMLPNPEVAERFRRQDRYIVDTDTPQLHVIARKQKPGADGKTIWLDINKLPIHDRNGKVIGILGVLEDITQRKLAEDALRLEQRKSEALLLNILPAAIAQRLKERHSAIAEHFEEVTILFADIVGFTPLSANLEPIELVGLLNHIFSTFDRLADKHGLEKIKTIGDAYMVVGGLPVPHPDRDSAIADMALEMQQAIEYFSSHEAGKFSSQLAEQNGQPLQIRIGINTGSVVAGVIGIKKFIYDLWGDAVNIASRMESQGKPDRIQVSAATYARLKERYLFEKRGAITVKGKGKMTTYWLVGKQETEISDQ